MHYVGNFFNGMGGRPFGVHAEIDELGGFTSMTNGGGASFTSGSNVMTITSMRNGYFDVQDGLNNHVLGCASTPCPIPAGTYITAAPAGNGVGTYTLSANATLTATAQITAFGTLNGINEYVQNTCLVPNDTFMVGMTTCVYATDGLNGPNNLPAFTWANFSVVNNTFIANTHQGPCPTGFYLSDGWTSNGVWPSGGMCPQGGPITSRLVGWGTNLYVNSSIQGNYFDDNSTSKLYAAGALVGGTCIYNEALSGTLPGGKFINTPAWGFGSTSNISLTSSIQMLVDIHDGWYGWGGIKGDGPPCH